MSEITGLTRTKLNHIEFEKAKELAENLGHIKNSITKGQGNVAGFSGELMVAKFLGVDLSHTKNYDMIYNGLRVDVKTKRTNYPPKPSYECSIAKTSLHQDCDLYVFVRVLPSLNEGWILGYKPQSEYFKEAKFWKKGEIDPSNNWKVSVDCYNLAISKLDPLGKLRSL
jgi:hypothetical protein